MQTKKIIRVATRPSKLAVTQTKQTVAALQRENPDIEFEIIEFSTKGDRNHTSTLSSFGGTGVFVKELEQALLEGKADIAVHSLKDVPSGQPDGLKLASFPRREDVHDTFISRNNLPIEEMPENFVLGTGSPRRVVQLSAIRPDAQCKEIRGNIDTRLQKLQDGEYDAIILAQAGMNRLGVKPKGASILPIQKCLPAVGQGCIAIECRAGDEDIISAVRTINHPETELCVRIERAFMSSVEGGCKFPLAAHAFSLGKSIIMRAVIGDIRINKFLKADTIIQKESPERSAALFAEEFKLYCFQAGIDCNAV